MIEEGDLLVIDADADIVVVNPSAEEIADFHRRVREQGEQRAQLRKLKGRLARTSDGNAVELLANIELPQDARDALEAGADGIGLFRSEFLFMDRNELPSEDEQYEAYARVARAMKGKPVVIRTLDIGADKVLTAAARESLGMGRGAPRPESNPALGLRAIRYCLAYPELFLTQLRAILRASEVGTGPHPRADAGARARDRAGAGVRRAREGAAEGAQAEVRRPRADRRHDRGAGGCVVGDPVRREAEVPVDRHQRPDPVHAGDRPGGRERRPSLRPPASGRAPPDREHDQGRGARRRPGRRVRRTRGRTGR